MQIPWGNLAVYAFCRILVLCILRLVSQVLAPECLGGSVLVSGNTLDGLHTQASSYRLGRLTWMIGAARAPSALELF